MLYIFSCGSIQSRKMIQDFRLVPCFHVHVSEYKTLKFFLNFEIAEIVKCVAKGVKDVVFKTIMI